MKESSIEWFIEKLPQFGIRVMFALLILTGGFWLASRLKVFFRNRMIKREVDPSIREFLLPIIDTILKILIILTAISTVGIEITSFSAIMLGLAAGVGMSLQGSLSNFAGGLLIIFFKPFKIGDYIEALSNSGTVESISILYTSLITDKQQLVILPNSSLLNNPIKNYSVLPNRMMDIKIGISYNENIKNAINLLENMLKEEPKILRDKPAKVDITELTDKQVILAVRAYTTREDYWNTLYKIQGEFIEIMQKYQIDMSQLPDKIVVPDKP